MIETADKKKQRDIRFIKLDETQYWDKEFLARIGAAKVYGVYFYDASVGVHLCSLSTSYELNYIESQTDHHLSDEDDAEFRQADAFTEPVSYFLKRDIDRISIVSEFELMGLDFDGSVQAKVDSWNEVTEDQTDEEVREEIEEYCRGNAI